MTAHEAGPLSVVVSFVVFYALTFISAWAVSPLSRRRTLLYLLGSLALHLVAAFVIPSFVIFDDERNYFAMGEGVARSLEFAPRAEWADNAWGNVTGVFFYLFGASLLTLRPLNTFLGIVGAFLLGQVARLLRSRPDVTARIVRWGLFLPPLVFISSIALKEQVVAFGLILCVLGFAKRGLIGILASAVGVLLLLHFRVNLGLIVAPLVALHYLARYMIPKPAGSMGRLAAWAVGAAVVLGAVYWVADSEYVQRTTLVQILKGTDTRGQQVMSESRATYARYLGDGAGALGFAVAPVLSLYSPSPLRPISSPEAPVFVEAVCFTLLLYIATPYFFLGAVDSFRSHERLMVLTVFLAVFFTASLSIFTYAPEAFRFRWPGLPLFFALAAFGLTSKRAWRRKLICGWWVSALAFSVVYLKAMQVS